jgi:hypothetical protein
MLYMAKDEQLLIRMNGRTKDAIEDFAEEYEYNTSEAARKMIKGRLAGEGYLEGATVVDGGMAEGVDERLEDLDGELQDTRSKVEYTQSEVKNLSEKIDETKSDFRKIGPGLIVCLLWIGTEIAVGIPGTALTIGTGLGALGILLVGYSQVISND